MSFGPFLIVLYGVSGNFNEGARGRKSLIGTEPMLVSVSFGPKETFKNLSFHSFFDTFEAKFFSNEINKNM